MQIAVLGMGNMGRALACRLAAQGQQVRVWNRTPGRAGEAVAAGAVEERSPDEAARGCEAVIMSLADDEAALAVMGRLAEAASGAKRSGANGSGPDTAGADGPVVVDMSTVAPGTSRRLAELAPGHRFVAAPIIAAPVTVAAGRASGLLGGERRLVDRLEPLWCRLFEAHWYCGEDPGRATTFKLLNNYLLMAGIALIAEVVATAEAAELDTKLLREVLDQWPTVPIAVRNRIDDIIGGEHQGWFSTRLGAKDVRHVVAAAEAGGLALPIARLVGQRYERAAELCGEGADIGAVVEVLRAERRAGRRADGDD
ncbi:dehydrogenase [Sphaerisporangium melleum]|uniref:Dehydrogenase n=1 Tax=Sphaerisporangium melleum TaxID=321316 RepID=A0A917R9H5_9ACTN|nr:NAD(P)-binding domain-containing protein [Sphaerisporangium melleum]GGK95681.1 dehydrogenase [Sphaerisporangium melleum]GII70633.1 dehydrogenase [Sphaerisporangium melleum]